MFKDRFSKEEYVLSVAGGRPDPDTTVGLQAVPDYILDTLVGKNPSFILGFAVAFGIGAQILDNSLLRSIRDSTSAKVLTQIRAVACMFQGIEYVACKTLIERGVVEGKEPTRISPPITH